MPRHRPPFRSHVPRSARFGYALLAIFSQIMTISGGLVVRDAVRTGLAPDFHRHTQAMFSVAQEPAWFWVSLLVYGAFTAFFALATGGSV